MPANYLPSLTPLRGIAALMVLIYHYQVLVMHVVNPKHNLLINKWYLMVDFFFILSGFIITHVYQHKFQQKLKWTTFRNFILSRFARLYPLHIFTLLLTICIYLALKHLALFNDANTFIKIMLNPDAILANIFLVQTVGPFPEPTWNSPSWSISVEWWTYMLFPFLVLLYSRLKQWANWIILLMTLLGYLAIMYYYQPMQFAARQDYLPEISDIPNTIDVMIGSSFLRCFCGFILGMTIYSGFTKRWGENILCYSSAMIATVLLLTIGWSFNMISDIFSVFIFGLMILMAVYNKGFIHQLLNRKAFNFLGEISYSVYMIHIPIILFYHAFRLFAKSLDPEFLPVQTSIVNHNPETGSLFGSEVAWTGLVIFILITLTFALTSYNFIEKPMRTLINKKLRKHSKKKLNVVL